MQRMGGDQIGDVGDVTVLELVLLGLDAEGVALEGYDFAEPEVFVAELLRRIEVVFTFFGVDLDFVADVEVTLNILDGG